MAAAVGLALLLFANSTDFNRRGLDRAITSFLPVNAANYLLRNPAPGPLYNTLDWGGFLIWYTPNYPVAIDGRTDLYGDELNERFFKTANGAPSYVNDPYLNQAGVVILQKGASLGSFWERTRGFDWCIRTNSGWCLFASASRSRRLKKSKADPSSA